jgi:multimeric flavodoxin WrbA
MKILALSASPHANGNSARLVDELLSGAREAGAQTERLDLNRLHIRGCQGDYACKRHGRCGVKDDMQTVYDKIDDADAVVFASPVYMGTINAQLKTTLDRLYQYLNPDMTSRIQPPKRSALVITQGQPDEDKFAQHLQAVPWSLGLLGFGRTEVLLGGGLRDLDAAGQRPELLARARELGRKLAQPATV